MRRFWRIGMMVEERVCRLCACDQSVDQAVQGAKTRMRMNADDSFSHERFWRIGMMVEECICRLFDELSRDV